MQNQLLECKRLSNVERNQFRCTVVQKENLKKKKLDLNVNVFNVSGGKRQKNYGFAQKEQKEEKKSD